MSFIGNISQQKDDKRKLEDHEANTERMKMLFTINDELKAQIEELENWKAQVLAMAVGDEVPKLLPYLRSEWVKTREQAKAEGETK